MIDKMSIPNYLLEMNGKRSLENFDIDDPTWEPSIEQRGGYAFQCKQCLANFHTKDQLDAHLICHPDLPCEKCGKTFKNKHLLAHHLITHNADHQTHMCKTCGKTFKTKHYLAQHLITHDGDGQKHECETCGKTFKRRNTLLGHLKTHTGASTCKICEKVLKNAKSLRDHMKYVHGENLKVISCEICGLNFKRKYLLDQHVSDKHLQSSETFKGHPCKICGKIFKRKKSISRHIKDKHVSSPGYDCEKCGKHYQRRVKMTEHLKHCDGSLKGQRYHTLSSQQEKQKNFLCHLCTSNFTTSYGLGRHLVYQHSNRLQCHICKKKCHYDKQFVDHLKLAHNCDPPKDLTVKNRNLPHKRTKDGKIVCKICSKEFTKTNHLRYHNYKEHGAIISPNVSRGKLQKRICPFCSKGICGKPNYIAHINAHTGNRQYQCPMCPVRVTARSNLNCHIRSAHYYNNPLYCRACRKLFCTKEKFESHAQEVHVGKHPFMCEQCYLGFDNETKYQNHMKKSHRYKTPDEEKKFRCHLCHKRFVFRHSLHRHIQKCTSKPKLSTEKFKTKENNCDFALNKNIHETLIYEFVCKICFSIFNGNNELIRHFENEHSNVNLPDETLLCVNTKTEGRQYGCKDPYFSQISTSKLNKEPFFCGVCHTAYHSKNSFDSHMQRFHPSYFDDPPTLEGDEAENMARKSLEEIIVMQEFVCKHCFFVTSELALLYGHMSKECDGLSEPDEVLYCLNKKNEKIKYQVVDEFFSKNDSMFKKIGFVCKLCLAPFAFRIFYERHITKKHPQFVEEYRDNLLDVEETFSERNALSVTSSDFNFSDESSSSDGGYEDHELDIILADPGVLSLKLKKTRRKHKRTRGKSLGTSFNIEDSSVDDDSETENYLKNFRGPLPDFYSCAFCEKATAFGSLEKLEKHAVEEHQKRKSCTSNSVYDDDYNPTDSESGTEEPDSSEGYLPSADDRRNKKMKFKNLKRKPKRGIRINTLKEKPNLLKLSRVNLVVADKPDATKLSTERFEIVNEENGNLSKESSINEPAHEIAENVSKDKEPPLTFVCKACKMVYFTHIGLDAHISKIHPDYYEIFSREEVPKYSIPRFKSDDSDLVVRPSAYEFPDLPGPLVIAKLVEEPTLPKLPDPEFARKVYGIKDSSKTIESKTTDSSLIASLPQPSSKQTSQPSKHVMETANDILDEALSSVSNSRNNSNAVPDLGQPPRVKDDDVRCSNISTTGGHFQPQNTFVQSQNANHKNTACYSTHAEHNFSNSCMDCPRFFENLPREVHLNNQAFGAQHANHNLIYHHTHLSEYDRFCNTSSTQCNYTNLQNAHNYAPSAFSQTVPPPQNYSNANAEPLNFNPNPTMATNFAPLAMSNFAPTPTQNVASHVNNHPSIQHVPSNNFGFIEAYQNYQVNAPVPYQNEPESVANNVNSKNEKSDTEDGGSFGIPDCNFVDSDSSVDDPAANCKKTFTDISDAKKNTAPNTDKVNETNVNDNPVDPKINEASKPTRVSPQTDENVKDKISEEARKTAIERAKREVVFCDECPTYYKGKMFLLKHYKKEHPSRTEKINELTTETNKTCEKCQKTFDSNYSLMRHVHAVHESLRPFACDECSLTFKLKGALKQHKMFTHLDSKPEQCRLCFFCTKYPRGLRNHIKQVHEGVKRIQIQRSQNRGRRKRKQLDYANRKASYSCQECTIMYFNRQLLLSHYENNHSQCLDKIETLKKLVENEKNGSRLTYKVAKVRKKGKNVKSREAVSSCSSSEANCNSDNATEIISDNGSGCDENSDKNEIITNSTPKTRPSRACRPKNLKESD